MCSCVTLHIALLCHSSFHAPAGSGGTDWKAYVKAHPRKVQKRVRKGIPDQLRGLVWQLLSGGRDLALRNEGGHF